MTLNGVLQAENKVPVDESEETSAEISTFGDNDDYADAVDLNEG